MSRSFLLVLGVLALFLSVTPAPRALPTPMPLGSRPDWSPGRGLAAGTHQLQSTRRGKTPEPSPSVASPAGSSTPSAASGKGSGNQGGSAFRIIPLDVQVVDAYTGLGVPGAPVQLIGSPYLKTTDASGWARFRAIPGGIGVTARLWTTPEGYAPGAKEVPITSNRNFATLYVPPTNTFSTGLIDPAQGGVFVLDGDLPTSPPTPFYMEVEVPPLAFSEWVSINITPYPGYALWYHGIPSTNLLFGAVHVNVTDSAGQTTSETTAVPVTFRTRGYVAGSNLSLWDTDNMGLYRYDYQEHEFAYDSAPTAIDLANNMIEVQTTRFSILAGCSPVSRDNGGPPPPDPPTFELTGHSCDLVCTSGVTCGINNSDCHAEFGTNDQTSVSAEIAAAFEAAYGVTVGNEMLGKAETKVGIKISGSLGTTITAGTTKSGSGGVTQGSAAWGGSCYHGIDKIYVIYNTWTVSIPGIGPVGTIKAAEAIITDSSDRQFSSSCCEEYVPLPSGIPKKPDDCTD